MKRPTIADLAQAAGVSMSTVNRLLHGGATVRSETVEHVVETAERIGFYGLGTLRERRKPHRNLGFLMQRSHRPLYQLWAAQIVAAAARRTDTVIKANVLFEDDLAPEAVATNLLSLGKDSDAVAVITADHPLVSQVIDELRATRVPVVAYITDLSAARRGGFVGTDNWKGGRTAAWFIRQTVRERGKVFPLIGSHRYQCQNISDASFRSYMREHAPDFDVSDTLLVHEDPGKAHEVIQKLIDENPDLMGIFVNDGATSGVLGAMRELSPERQRKIRIVCRDLGPETRKGLSEGLITASICHPFDKMPQELIDVMLRLVECPDTPSIEQRLVPFEILTPESIWT
ncbi:LacI family DNA-binding transcriptional regulator [Bradyrhizobium sp. CCGUVB4N]|uniref:LacI family DNA-binding transcriptional regulator n=1 Tax=Bradyrhizobium sp. CCGUVB4N TaxID=2949631 RepID=UPI0020B2C40A|nr:LacI family DNA-binding transcriptional regulator [Bradyrhizobium sp. CCGUVB4N]MCP3380031.1 LacI family DNA-binding transcriptional regulator [Bradyrhizobium sp. CCGUVB4N]